jgi:sterol 3beta-glucosyltransferase
MASQDRGRARSSRRLTKKRRDSEKEPRRLSLDIPERFKDGDDADEDVTAPKRNNTMSMNQSIFSMIARAGQHSQTDLATMQEVDSGDSDAEGKKRQPYHSLDGAARLSRLSSANDFPKQTDKSQDEHPRQGKQHRRVLSEHKLLRSLPKLKSRKDARLEVQSADQMSSSQLLPPRPPLQESPAMTPSERSKAKSKATSSEDTQVEKVKSSGRRSRQSSSAGTIKASIPVTLAQRIRQIFEFEEIEEVISEYPCWLLQSILLQGYMYITQKHICFYAYIPKKHVSSYIASRKTVH